MLGGGVGDLVIVVAAIARLALGIDREDHRGDVFLAVMRGGLVDGRRMGQGALKYVAIADCRSS